MKQNPEAGGKGSEFCLARLEPAARQGSHRVDGKSVETPREGAHGPGRFAPSAGMRCWPSPRWGLLTAEGICRTFSSYERGSRALLPLFGLDPR